MQVLVVDDAPFSRKMTIRALPEPMRDRVIQATNGREAVVAFRSHRPDLVLLDLTMPDMDGFEALAEIRSIDPQARVVIISADVQEGARQRCAELGAMGFIAKPIKGPKLEPFLKAA